MAPFVADAAVPELNFIAAKFAALEAKVVRLESVCLFCSVPVVPARD